MHAVLPFRAATTHPIARARKHVQCDHGARPPKAWRDVVATTSGICYIDGDQGVLAYRGIDVHELADHSTFEETCYLLWYGRLPSAQELKEIRDRLAEERKLDPAIINLLRVRAEACCPMDVLRTAVSALSFYDADETQ